jgi:para-nitrobenzyl esterase
VAPNAALLDAALALRWAQEHAERFGGDPENITIFGESAGATMVTMLMAHAPARGLFRRAIAQSAMDPLRVATVEAASASTLALFRELGIAQGDVKKLRQVTLPEISAAQARVEADRDGWPHFLPVRDAASLPEAPADAVLSSETPKVPLIIGYNRDEWNLFDAANVVEWGKPLADEDAIAQISGKLGDRAGAAATLFDVYRASRAARGLRSDPRALVRAILGDLRFRVGSQAMAARYASREPHTYSYLFTYPSPAMRGVLGACHALDLPFVFGNLHTPNQDRFAGTGEPVERLSRTMRHAWITFARGGAPELPGGVAWPAYDAALRRTMIFDLECRVENDPFGEERHAFPP